MLKSANADLTELRVRAEADPDSVNESDYYRLFSMTGVLLRRFENDFFQYRSGTFDPGGWEGYRRSFTTEILASPTVRPFWEQTRVSFAPEFVSYVDNQLDPAREARREDLSNSLRE